jgi:glycosyltransferase involved in cell wall biosynthesis
MKLFNKFKSSKFLRFLKDYIPFHNYYKNVLKTNYDKNVLISYITHPIRHGLIKVHSNYLELYVLLEIFNSLKFNIDLVNYTYKGEIDYSKYDVIFGFGYSFGKSFYDSSAKNALKVCYLTGSLELFNQMKRNKYLKERKGVTVIPRRNYYWPYLQESISMSDGVIVTGNEWTASTVRPYNSKVLTVRLPIFLTEKEKILSLIKNKDFNKAKKIFLWFGSSGALLKGLDLCLDIFSDRKDLFLHVCGPVNKEEDFWTLYKRELTELSNIKYHGFVNIDSDLFWQIVSDTAFAIFPSASEGTSGSLLHAMNYGLIPIATIESGVNIKKDYGILLEDYKIEYIVNKINEIIDYRAEKLREMALITVEYTHSNHNRESYQLDVLNALKSLGVT